MQNLNVGKRKITKKKLRGKFNAESPLSNSKTLKSIYVSDIHCVYISTYSPDLKKKANSSAVVVLLVQVSASLFNAFLVFVYI